MINFDIKSYSSEISACYFDTCQNLVQATCTTFCSSHLHDILFKSPAQQSVQVTCKTFCSSHLHDVLFKSPARHSVQVTCTTFCSSHLHQSLLCIAAVCRPGGFLHHHSSNQHLPQRKLRPLPSGIRCHGDTWRLRHAALGLSGRRVLSDHVSFRQQR